VVEETILLEENQRQKVTEKLYHIRFYLTVRTNILRETKCHDNFYILSVMFVCLVVFNPALNNISVISWRSVLLVEETGVPGENHRPAASH
jgi:hypothetical protein